MKTDSKKTHNVFKRDLAEVLRAPRITEKASSASESRVYVFNVATWANKNQIASAVKRFYSVTPMSIRTAPVRPKKVVRRGTVGMTSMGKKAYIELKKGDSIELV